ncbi:hypothetical protein ISG33_04805 [Glaciecola sp. MH2013]|uniref:DUF6279 family lipoprotein n=1 Tax=Glaciecola sp. MH2013 TaxID=2785524 RepID=UPI00189EA792|nr:DUF6279 family lipoprotein [Glaciecola sp. MH2013]MBF7072718.1 hypothetical protein [Glaciecola sp. MH2013]
MKKFIVLLTILALSGCSAKFAYNNIDWLAYWYIDDYIELTDEQEEAVDKKLLSWIAWHRNNELPQYYQHLAELSKDIQSKSMSVERMEYHQEKAADHWYRLRERIVPDLVELSPMLTRQQVVAMFEEIDEQNQEEKEERREREARSDDKKKRDSIKRNKKNLTRWLGRLTSEQENLIENMYGEYHRNGELWQQYRESYQGELKALLLQEKRDDAFKTRLSELLLNPEAFRSDELNQKNKENSDTYKNFLLSVDALATEKQREHLIDEIAEFSDDIKELMAP